MASLVVIVAALVVLFVNSTVNYKALSGNYDSPGVHSGMSMSYISGDFDQSVDSTGFHSFVVIADAVALIMLSIAVINILSLPYVGILTGYSMLLYGLTVLGESQAYVVSYLSSYLPSLMTFSLGPLGEGEDDLLGRLMPFVIIVVGFCVLSISSYQTARIRVGLESNKGGGLSDLSSSA